MQCPARPQTQAYIGGTGELAQGIFTTTLVAALGLSFLTHYVLRESRCEYNMANRLTSATSRLRTNSRQHW